MCLHTGHGNEDAQYTLGGTVVNCIGVHLNR